MKRSEIPTRPLAEVLLEADHDDLEFMRDPRGRAHLDRWVRKANLVFDPTFEDPAVDRMREAWRRNALLDEGGQSLFRIRAGVGDDEANGRVDVAKIETLLEAAGAFGLKDLDGPTGFFAADKGDAIRAFQRANGIAEDGRVQPNDATMRALQSKVRPKIGQAIALRRDESGNAGPGSGAVNDRIDGRHDAPKPAGETKSAKFFRPIPIPGRPPPVPVPPTLPPISGGRPPNPIDPNERKRPVDPPKVMTGTTLPPIEEGKPQILIFPDISEEIGQIYIDKRRESQETRDEIDYIRDYFVKVRGWKHEWGGRHAPGTKNEKGEDISGQEQEEEYIPGPWYAFPDPDTGKHGDKRPGHVRPDLTFVDQNGNIIYVQHVSVDKNGKPTDQENAAAIRLVRATGNTVIMIPKLWQLRKLKNRKSR